MLKHLRISDNVVDDLLRLIGIFILGAVISLGYRPIGIFIILLTLLLIFIRIIIEIVRWFKPSFLMKQGKSK